MPQSLFKPKRRDARTGKTRESRYWWGQYRLEGDAKYTRVSLKTSDKRIAQKRLEELVTRKERLQAGILPPDAMAEAAAKPVTQHLEDFVACLDRTNRSREYTRKIRQRVTRLIRECRWERVADVTAASFIAWRNNQAAGLAPKTINDYQDAVYALLAWLKSTSQVMHNPIEGVGRMSTTTGRTFLRRALTDAEAERLVDSSGPRSAVYLLALHTGLRRGELRKLLWDDVDLHAGLIRLRAEATKAGRPDVLPLSRPCIAVLAELASDRGTAGRVFSSGMPSHHTVRADFERAGICRVDAKGRKVDFHALRMTFITNLQRAGVPQRHAMALARHTDPKLTANTYADVEAMPLAQAVGRLPDPTGRKAAQETAQENAHGPVSGCLVLTHPDPDACMQYASETLVFQGFSDVSLCQSATGADTEQQWSRGESNPRAAAVSRAPLRA